MCSSFSGVGRKCRVVVTGCLVSCIVYAVPFSFGVLFPNLLETFGSSRASAATVQATFQGVACSSGIISGVLIKKTSLFHVSVLGAVLLSAGLTVSYFAETILLLDILIGVIAGLGVSMLSICSNVEVGATFEGHMKNLALSIVAACVNVGCLSYPYVLQYLVAQFGLRGTFLILGGLYVNNFAVALSRSYTRKDAKGKGSDVQGFKIRQSLSDLRSRLIKLFHVQFSVLLVTSALTNGFQNGYLVVIIDLLMGKGFTKEESVIFYTVYNICKIVGNLTCLTYDKVRNALGALALLSCACVVGSVGYVLLSVSDATPVTLVGMVLAGTSIGVLLAGPIVAIANIVEPDQFSVGLGLHMTTNGMVTLSSGPIYGLIRDQSQSYENVTILMAAIFGAAGLLFTAGDVWHKWKDYTKALTPEAVGRLLFVEFETRVLGDTNPTHQAALSGLKQVAKDPNQNNLTLLHEDDGFVQIRQKYQAFKEDVRQCHIDKTAQLWIDYTDSVWLLLRLVREVKENNSTLYIQ